MCLYVHLLFIICLSLLENKFQVAKITVLFTDVFQVPRNVPDINR